MTRHIGIVGCSAEGAALCYRTICQEGMSALGPHAHPEVTMHTPSLAVYMARIEAGDWAGVGETMLRSVDILAGAGADFVICPDNTIHQALPGIRARSALPWLHIAEAVADEAAIRGYRRLALTGTRWLVESDVYPEALAARGLACVRPDAAEREDANRIIMDELVPGRFTPAATAVFARIIGRLGAEEGCDAAILGCTEIPLVVSDETSPLPVLDSTRILARTALRHALA